MDERAIETIELELAILIRRINSISNYKKFGNLDRSAYLLLHQINVHNGSAGVKILADEFQLDISTVSRQTASLEKKEYVYRIPDPSDGRAYFLQITELGKKELLQYKKSRMERVSEIIESWTDEEREIFGQLLKKFNRGAINS
ncbi:MarR family winged helix-turn-helix transcriptional regulator [Bacillus sp. S/N-304-OC-R1]|uniref:MarR family winged helix-turn-helix transcriptional regulator n=1 Tax=Bacillus sp. S/N-304-OC-R1 TaxID=2758034 RepID=UPI001C8EE51C|nr:MarR family transcriptional regulator [Bacillus sp. S/N-304-OC-R1]MBY0122478.1 MarR family transcriptional regulator [Bacillus sp. S/N-304-OC-R1]